jgi:hypothetical protein
MRVPGPSRRLRLCVARVFAPMSPSWSRAFHPARWVLVVGLHELWWAMAQPSSSRQPEPEMGVRGISTAAAGPGGGATLGWGASVAPPLIFPPLKAATANSPAPAGRVRVVLLPYPRTEPTGTRTSNRPTERDQDLNQGDSSRHHSDQSDGATRVIAANGQWYDAELAMKTARRSFEGDAYRPGAFLPAPGSPQEEDDVGAARLRSENR